jgi:probable HAF family extracellular repeat protein
LDAQKAATDSNGATWTEAHGINDRGDIVGVYRDANDVFHAYLYQGGVFNAFPDVPGGLAGTTIPYGINQNDDVVGSYADTTGLLHGFLHTAHGFITLDAPNAAQTVATGINDNDEVVGWYLDGSGNRKGFLWTGGAFAVIDPSNGNGGSTRLAAINNIGQIVGAWRSADGSSQLGFVATLTDLWRDATNLGGGWRWLSWFGWFNTTNSPWMYHQTLGWLYAIGASTYDIWFWDVGMNDFWWTTQLLYPCIYRAGDGAWLYYLEGSSNPRQFYNFNTSQWEKH